MKNEECGSSGIVAGIAAATLIAMLCALLAGCNTADPTQKAQTNESKGNTVNVCLSFGSGTNAVSVGDVSITMSDVIGTQVQSADTAGNESVEQRPSATMTPGVTGDKPIETIGTVAAAAITGGASSGAGSLGSLAEQAKKYLGATNAAGVAAGAVTNCADGSCSEK